MTTPKRERVELAVGQVWRRRDSGLRRIVVQVHPTFAVLRTVPRPGCLIRLQHDHIATGAFGGRGWGAYRFYDEDQPTTPGDA